MNEAIKTLVEDLRKIAKDSYATGHGDTFEDILGELVGQAEARGLRRAARVEISNPTTGTYQSAEAVHAYRDAVREYKRLIRALIPGEPAPKKEKP